MKDVKGRVAVVTGAASGIGLASAHRFADEGMRLVLADIESEPLAAAEAAIKAKGADVLAVRTDVASPDAVSRLADAAFSTFGNVHIVFNNAGVAATGATLRLRAWEGSLADWDWTLSVNFMGVLHGVRAFVPRMLENGDEGHIVNTASIAGLLTAANPYNVSKHGVVCLTEGIYRDLREMGARLSASVVCPGLIRTRILDAERNRADGFGTKTDVTALRDEVQQFVAGFEAALQAGYAPEVVAEHVLDGIRQDRFYILPAQPDILEFVDARMTGILERRNPDPRR
jgi:NAD(P)-dependent dehydrogenase (short-subunit alcohol dehydrogenase family)